jgi:hypothetical protein
MQSFSPLSGSAICLWLVLAASPVSAQEDVIAIIETLQPYVANVVESFDDIPEERRQLLDEMAGLIAERVQAGEAVPISFICTHNSRRSHLSQVWAQTAAHYYGLPGVTAYSGGTAATACNTRTVRVLRRAGFSVVRATDEENPHYLIQYSEELPPIDAFSKVYNEDGNPTEGYLAAMCCADADEACPVVHGSVARIRLCYEDPKVADGTPEENARYDERCRQIAIEMFYVMSRVDQAVNPTN